MERLSATEKEALLSQVEQGLRERVLEGYRPYPKQAAFHAYGATKRERLLRAGNQAGKSFCLGAEMAFHLTGIYPAWWLGRRWERPIVAWATGETAETTRDNPQRVLLGLPGEEGTGMVPKKHMKLDPGDYGKVSGVADLYDFIWVRHHTNGVADGWSFLRFKYYLQGAKKWQGPPVDFVWFDEEPPEDVYAEGMARITATRGMVALSFTPLMGMSTVVKRYLMDKSADRSDTNMTIHDAEHIPESERAKIIAGYPAHQRDARAMGIPTMGSGLIFPVDERSITVESFAIPIHWFRIAGLDFGWDHPTAAAWLAWDKDNDVVYVTDCYRVAEGLVPVHASALRGRGTWIPVAWPHDGNNETAAGPQLAVQYRAEGINMRPENAKFPEGMEGTERSRISVEAGVAEMLTRMTTGRWKVFSHCLEWFEEFRLYHREDGLIVKKMDDLLSASRYALMDLRFAEAKRVHTWRDKAAAHAAKERQAEWVSRKTSESA